MPQQGGDFWYLGLIGGTGFLILLGYLLWRPKTSAQPDVLGGLATLSGACVLLGTVGGFGLLLSLGLPPCIRCYERLSIYLGFLSLTAVALGLDYVRSKLEPRIGRIGWWPLLAVFLGLGLLDQTSSHFEPQRGNTIATYAADSAWVAAIEAQLPPETALFQLPCVPFPESARVANLPDYELLRGYVHSTRLRWSVATMKGRPGADWQEQLTSMPVEAMIQALQHAGFGGVTLDRRGLADRGLALESRLAAVMRATPIESPTGDQVCYPFPIAHSTDFARP